MRVLPHTEAGMFCLPRHILFRESIEDWTSTLDVYSQFEKEDGFRSGPGPKFLETWVSLATGQPPYDWDLMISCLICPICGCGNARSESFDSYGGTTEGYTRCGFCDYTCSWADISAVI